MGGKFILVFLVILLVSSFSTLVDGADYSIGEMDNCEIFAPNYVGIDQEIIITISGKNVMDFTDNTFCCNIGNWCKWDAGYKVYDEDDMENPIIYDPLMPAFEFDPDPTCNFFNVSFDIGFIASDHLTDENHIDLVVEVIEWGNIISSQIKCTTPKKRINIDKNMPPTPSPKANPSSTTTNPSPNIYDYSVIDPETGIDYYEYQIDSTSGSWTSLGTNLNFDVPSQSDGTHTVYVRAIDKAGNVGNHGSVNIYIDSKMNCECSSGPCCDGCYYTSSGTICNTDYGTPIYACINGNGLGSDIYRKKHYQTCSGDSAVCDGPTKSYSFEVYKDCGPNAYCAEDGDKYCSGCSSNCDNYCYSDTCYGIDPDCTESGAATQCSDLGGNCQNDVCVGKQCGYDPSLPCVYNDGCLKPGTYAYRVCEQTGVYEYSCKNGNNAGDQVFEAEYHRLCDGVSPNCDGPLTLSGWNVYDACDNTERCANDGDTSCTSVNPEVCNGIDDDWDTKIDDNLIGSLCPYQNGICSGKRELCIDGYWNSCDADIYGSDYETSESKCDNLDNDCDGSIDESLDRSCGVTDVGACTFGTETCSAGVWSTCNAVLPSEEVCNNLDDDCDGETDEGFTKETCSYICEKNGYNWTEKGGILNCCGDDVNESNPYEVDEISCNDNKDNDCDGKIDMEDKDCYGCSNADTKSCPLQQGVCQDSYQTCSNEIWPGCTISNYGFYYENIETICDARDNDCDGEIDEGCDCVVPYGNMSIKQDTNFCYGSYNLSDQIFIDADSLSLNCRNSTLYAGFNTYAGTGFALAGINIDHHDSINITNCDFVYYSPAIYASHSNEVNIFENSFTQSSWYLTKIELDRCNNCNIHDNYFDSGGVADYVGNFNKIYANIFDGKMDYLHAIWTSSGNSTQIYDNLFVGDFYIAIKAKSTHDTIIRNNLINNSKYGIVLDFVFGPIIERNNLTSGEIGIDIYETITSALVYNNTLANNIYGIFFRYLYYFNYNNSFHHNILNNDVNFFNKDNRSQNLSHNYWGTSDIQTIQEKIIDKEDNSSYGTVAFQPFYCSPDFSSLSPCPILHEISFYPGWNLMSFPNMPQEPVHYGSIFTFNNQYKKYILPNSFQEGMAYWLKSDSENSYKVEEIPLSELQFPLTKGWNLIPYTSFTPNDITVAFSEVSTQFKTVFAYDAENQRWKKYSPKSISNTLTELTPGKSYWINLFYNQTWSFNPSTSKFYNDDPFIPDCVEGDEKPCGSDIGECQQGKQTCINGIWAECHDNILPQTEICDGLDNDCDGVLDNNLTSPNADNQEGICSGSKKICEGVNGWVNPDYSQIPQYESTENRCDGLDNDCDSETDESLTPPFADKQAGVCSGSKKVCDGINGWIEPDYTLITDYQSTENSCDQKDNDCDTETDEGCNCYNGQTRNCGSDIGECEFGTQTCDPNGNWGTCVGAKESEYEACPYDLKDNDCDGQTDENYCSNNYCYDWTYMPGPDYHIDSVYFGPYCSDKRTWEFADVDNDGYNEKYMLTGNTHRAWFQCNADLSSKVSGFLVDGFLDTHCYDGSCDSRYEFYLYEKEYDSPSNSITYPSIWCNSCLLSNPSQCSAYGWYEHTLIWCYDTNNNGQYCDNGDRIEPYLVINCGVNSDCPGSSVCVKPNINNPTTYYCS